MRSVFLIALTVVFCNGQVSGQGSGESATIWQVYSNAKYGYEIRFPKGFEVWPTGPAGERDGAKIRVGMKEYAAPTPVLDIKVHPLTAQADFPQLPMELNDLNVAVTDTELSGRAAREATYHWKSNGELAFTEDYLNGVVFHFAAKAGTRDMRDTEWWAIISSFRFSKK